MFHRSIVQVVLTVCCGATVLLQSCWSQRIRSQATASTRRDCEGKIVKGNICIYIYNIYYLNLYTYIYYLWSTLAYILTPIYIYVSYLCKRMNLMNFQKGLQVKWITFSTWRHQAESSFENIEANLICHLVILDWRISSPKVKETKEKPGLMQIHISPSGISKSVSEVLCRLCLSIILVWRRLDGIFLLYWSWKVVASCAFPNTI